MADLFGVMVCTRQGHPRRRWSSFPFSVAIHGLFLAVAVLVPIAATSSLPTPATMLAFTAPPAPSPPVLPAAPRLAPRLTQTASDTVPTDAPPVLVTTSPPAPAVWSTALVVPDSTVVLRDAEVSQPLFAAPAPVAPVRAGGQIQIPVKIVDVPPAYPAIAREMHVSGVVIIDAVIGVDGQVTQTKVLRSVRFLDQSAVEAVRQWRYRPTFLNGVPVAVILTVTVNFTLK